MIEQDNDPEDTPLQEERMAHGHLDLGPSEWPTGEIRIVTAAARHLFMGGEDDGRTWVERLQATLWVMLYGTRFLPDSHSDGLGAALTDAEAIEKLEAAATAHEGGLAQAPGTFPWVLFAPLLSKLLTKLVERLINR